MNDNRSFFTELKRRNVYKVGLAYAVVSWLLIQIATQVFPFFEIPNWAVRLVIVLLVLGFPAALIFSWAFEITPEGIKRESEVKRSESVRHHTGRKVVAITVVLAVLAGAMLVFQLVRPKATSSGKVETRATDIPDKSIAVLPFDNLSDDKSNAYFAEGIQDEILTRLSKVAALKVISRTSTQKYKSAPENLREIAKELGVAHVLEGSVQKVANNVKVSVQLIRATTDEHVWADSYNKKLDDVFAVEAEVASAIVAQLNARLTGAEEKAMTQKSTDNLAAYDAYLRGLAIEHQRYSYEDFQEATVDYQRAVELDRNFAVAWARLAALRSFLFFNGVDTATNSAEAVKEAADTAMRLQPELAEAWIAQGAYRYRVLRDFNGGLQAYAEAGKRAPNNSLVFQYMAYVERRLGRWNDAEQHYKRAEELDPQNFQLLVSIGNEFLNYLRRFDEAQAALDKALEISPNHHGTIAAKANLLQQQGRLAEAAAVLARIPTDSTDDYAVSILIAQAYLERHFDAGIAVIQRRLASLKPGETPSGPVKWCLAQLGYLYEWSGRPNEARAAFERALQVLKPSPDVAVGPDALGLPEVLACTYAGLGEKEKALAQAKQAVADYAGDAVNQPFAEATLAQIQGRFGDIDTAIAALPRLLEVPAGLTTANLRDNPLWDPLRNDPRFQELCHEPKK